MGSGTDATYQPSNYREQGGGRDVIGGELDIVSGGELDIESGGALKIAGTQVTASAAQLNDTNEGLDGANVDDVADDNVIGGIPVLHKIVIPGGAAADKDITLTHKTLITDVWAVHTGGNGETNDTIQVKNGANAITDAMDWSGNDKTVVRAGEIDDAQHAIAAAGTLRVTTVDDDGGSDVGAGIVYVRGLRVA